MAVDFLVGLLLNRIFRRTSGRPLKSIHEADSTKSSPTPPPDPEKLASVPARTMRVYRHPETAAARLRAPLPDRSGRRDTCGSRWRAEPFVRRLPLAPSRH